VNGGADLLYLRDGQPNALSHDKETQRRHRLADLLQRAASVSHASVKSELERLLGLIHFPVHDRPVFQVLLPCMPKVSVAVAVTAGRHVQGEATDADAVENFIQVLKEYWETQKPTEALAKAVSPSPAAELMLWRRAQWKDWVSDIDAGRLLCSP